MTSSTTAEFDQVTVPAKAVPTLTAMQADGRFSPGELRGAWLTSSSRNPALVVLTSTGMLVNAKAQLGSWGWHEVGPLTLVDGRHPQIRPAGAKPITLVWNEDPTDFAATYRAVRAEALGHDDWTGHVPVSRLVTTGTYPGHTITEVHGIVSDVVSSVSWGTADTDPAASFASATEGIRAQTERLGANAVIGLTAVALTPKTGLAALAGEAPGVLLMGTAVRITPT
ncbi:MAG: hypothetical protein ACSLEW_04095 [Nocardioides sp.]